MPTAERVKFFSDSLAEQKSLLARGTTPIEHAKEIEICCAWLTGPELGICPTACVVRPRLGSRRRRDRQFLVDTGESGEREGWHEGLPTFQVSDTNLTSKSMRPTAQRHALIVPNRCDDRSEADASGGEEGDRRDTHECRCAPSQDPGGPTVDIVAHETLAARNLHDHHEKRRGDDTVEDGHKDEQLDGIDV
jgi:hypothetical protein